MAADAPDEPTGPGPAEKPVLATVGQCCPTPALFFGSRTEVPWPGTTPPVRTFLWYAKAGCHPGCRARGCNRSRRGTVPLPALAGLHQFDRDRGRSGSGAGRLQLGQNLVRAFRRVLRRCSWAPEVTPSGRLGRRAVSRVAAGARWIHAGSAWGWTSAPLVPCPDP